MSRRAADLVQGEYTLEDPLENTDNFNIIQFLRETDFESPEGNTSLVSPTSSADSMQHSGVGPVPDPCLGNQIYQNRRLPESPPMTDIGGNASSSSSSSHHSDPMFSPNEFNGFSMSNDNGMLLGVNGLQNNMLQHEAMQQSSNRVMNQQAQNFWQNENQQHQQQQQQLQQQQQMMQQHMQQSPAHSIRDNRPQMENLYNILHASNDSALTSPMSDDTVSRKRSRLDTCETQKSMNASNMADFSNDENYNHQQAIKFVKFQEDQWNTLYDENCKDLQQLQVHVVADKGFNFSNQDNCFINQKKNHFQISVHVEASDSMPPKYVIYNNNYVPIRDFKLAFSGAKAEMPTSEIGIKQSRADRKPHPHTPVLFEIQERRMTKVTVPRLHFSETTNNNQRKNFRPNPDQRYYLLVVRLFASISDDVSVLIQSYASERVIVRATNPGSFEPQDSDAQWQKNGNALFTHGPVSVGTDRTGAKLTVDGDIYLTGRVINPSDRRLKEAITEKDASEALEKLLKLRVVEYAYKPEVAEQWGLTEEQRKRTGLIAQELASVLPDAVRDIGEYFTIDESRVFYETVLATQELCRLTGDLDSKIDEKVDEITKKLSDYARRKKLATSMSSNLNGDSKSLSLSKYSLTSTATNFTSNGDNKKRRSYRRRHSNEEYNALCSSKFTQGTIVTLVGVMAICLLAMSSLYVLDWHNRNYGTNHNYHVLPPASKGEPANLVISPLQYMPSYQPDAPPLLAHCFSPSCRTYCCGDKPTFDNTADDIIKIDEEAANRTTGIGRAPNFKTMSFGTGVSISIPILNITLDQRYCVEKSCNKRRGIFNLFIPVSRFMPDSPVEIKIDVPRQKLINNCGHLSDFNHKMCPLSRYNQQSSREFPTSYQILENTFELSVGSYIQSAYRFRVAFSTEACFSNEEGLNGNFEEYNLIFYRMCTPQNATAASAATTTTTLF